MTEAGTDGGEEKKKEDEVIEQHGGVGGRRETVTVGLTAHRSISLRAQTDLLVKVHQTGGISLLKYSVMLGSLPPSGPLPTGRVTSSANRCALKSCGAGRLKVLGCCTSVVSWFGTESVDAMLRANDAASKKCDHSDSEEKDLSADKNRKQQKGSCVLYCFHVLFITLCAF